jgi:hypothetical protein
VPNGSDGFGDGWRRLRDCGSIHGRDYRPTVPSFKKQNGSKFLLAGVLMVELRLKTRFPYRSV